jgi:predicted ATPase/class 3 adenylate cyclase
MRLAILPKEDLLEAICWKRQEERASMRALPTGTVTFLFSDIERSTRLLQRVGGEDFAALRAQHQALLRAAWAACGGVEIGTEGDSFFVAFSSAPAAVAAAAQATRALAAHPWPAGEAIRVRIGLHTGVPLVAGDTYVGLDVHRAARIAAAGHGGQILLSEATRALAEPNLPAGTLLRDLGEFRLKDLQRPEHLAQLILDGLPSDFPPLTTLDRARHNLPVQPTPLLGREREVGELSALLRRDDVRLVTLTGTGGTGKTRLGQQVAAELADAFADGVWFVRLARLTDPSLVLPTVAQTLGLHDLGGRPLEEQLREYLRARHLLLLLDNFEQLISAAPQVGGLLETSPRLRVLVTSRVPLHLRGEKEYPVAPLALPPLTTPSTPAPPSTRPATTPGAVERLSQYAAVALFIQRALDARPDFQVTNANAPAVAEICARLDGLPLAIELAAARVKLLPPQQLLQRLERRLPLLTGGAQDLEARQQTMRATLAWSEDLLQPAERTLFCRLAVFVGGCTLEAAEAICAAPEGVEPLAIDVLEGLGRLVDQSLVQQRDESGEARFSLLQVVREYALEHLETSGESDALHRAHLSYFLALAEEAEPHAPFAEGVLWKDRLEREHDNLRAALDGARARGAAELGLRLGNALWQFWFERGHLREGRAWLEALLASESAGNTIAPAVRARGLVLAGLLAHWQQDLQGAERLLEAGLALARAAGDRRPMLDTDVLALHECGLLAYWRGDLDQAETHLGACLALAQERADPFGISIALSDLAGVALYRGDRDLAAERYQQALAMFRQSGNQFGLGVTLGNLGEIALQRDDPARARMLFEEALAIWQARKNSLRIAETSESLAILAAGAIGRSQRAARLFGAAAAIREAVNVPLPASYEQHMVQEAVAAAKAALGEEAWASAFAAGKALSVEEAVAEALDDEPTG